MPLNDDVSLFGASEQCRSRDGRPTQNDHGNARQSATDHHRTSRASRNRRLGARSSLVDGNLIAPTRVFVPSPADYHQDHVAVAREIPISLYHAIGGIWPECGDKLEKAPYLYWHCVYCPFAEGREPNIRIVGDAASFATKIKAIEAYNSQGQIAPLIDQLRIAPPVEYLLEESFSLFHPGVYDHCFGV